MNRVSRKRKTEQHPDDILLNRILSSKNVNQSLQKELHDRFLNDKTGLPTEDYKSFLERIVNRLETMTNEERISITRTLMRWEENGLQYGMTGIISIHPTDPFYLHYAQLLQAIFGDNHAFKRADRSIDLANSTIVLMISEMNRGCRYGNACKRQNPLHRELMHSRLQSANNVKLLQGGKRRVKTHKRKTHKRKA